MSSFANILFCGPEPDPCNARCHFCIGKQIDRRRYHPNLDEYPLRGLDRLITAVRENGIRHVVFTGSNTDPLRYRHLDRLLDEIRARLPETCFSLHTNGRLASRRMVLVNRFDKICISLPSFRPATYRTMMGVPGVPALAAVLKRCNIPLKLSCIVSEQNATEIPAYLMACRQLGIRRVVLRKIFGEQRAWQVLLPFELGQPARWFCGSPVYVLDGIELTLWDFMQTAIESISLFSTGEISKAYQLAG